MALGYFLNYYLPPKKGRVGEMRKGRETILVTKQRQGHRGATWLLLSRSNLAPLRFETGSTELTAGRLSK